MRNILRLVLIFLELLANPEVFLAISNLEGRSAARSYAGRENGIYPEKVVKVVELFLRGNVAFHEHGQNDSKVI